MTFPVFSLGMAGCEYWYLDYIDQANPPQASQFIKHNERLEDLNNIKAK